MIYVFIKENVFDNWDIMYYLGWLIKYKICIKKVVLSIYRFLLFSIEKIFWVFWVVENCKYFKMLCFISFWG